MLSFGIPCGMLMLLEPTQFGFLTYWTLLLHFAYFTIDKASPHTNVAVRVLHGGSFAGAAAVLVGYALICIGGKLRFGTWYAWEKQIGTPVRLYEMTHLSPSARTQRAKVTALMHACTRRRSSPIWPLGQP